ncbi:MAG TPA: SprB repeat-containing protein [Flavobacteriales bacterium]|nr:SprB repeat-containing protein [Flavobacteriales bacterium]
MLAALMAFAVHEATAQLTVTLAPTNYNGYHITCFGQKDGAIDATVTGGTAPYSYLWSNGSTDEDIDSIPSGYYKITVMDADSNVVSAEITLREPIALRVGAIPFMYPNGLNISCHECYNGSIDITVTDGVLPYSYDWGDGVYTQDRSDLGAMTYAVRVTDGNGCIAKSAALFLTQPDRKDWTMEGNANTDAEQHFFGTTDSTDVVLKSNGQERLRLMGNGEVKLTSPLLGNGVVYLDGLGVLRGGGFPPNKPPIAPGLCRLLGDYPYWETRGNAFDDLCPEEQPVLGTRTNHALSIITADAERMIIHTNGKVGIGTAPPAGAITNWRLYVADGIATADVLVKHAPWPDYVFAEGYSLLPLNELRDFLQRHKHLPHVPSAAELDAQGGVALAEHARALTRTVEEQALYILQMEERLQRVEQRMVHLEASKP